ncbi:hypothetical protein [Oculatella sp. FACHB-28]|uniref:hypothetical protein n=1 Tax=Oculatella sp. FACHB-28 TaxID=2692845 RepID=UPI001F5552C5|nr:hypothetical protein [Oculatella sp. FACHB-28]
MGRLDELKIRYFQLYLFRPSLSRTHVLLGVWEGPHGGRMGYWLRWWNSDGEMLLWSEERTEQESQRAEQERQRAEQERQRAEALAERLRQLGIDPEV